MIQPMATWRLVLLELIVAAVLAAAAADAAAEQTCLPVEAFDPQNTVKPLQLPVADILADIAASVVSAGAVVDIAEKDEAAAAAAAAAVSPSLRELPRWNKSQIHQMDWMEGRMIP